LSEIAAGTADITDEYQFVQDTSRSVGFVHGDEYQIGQLDKNGNFIPDKRLGVLRRGAGASGIPPFRVVNTAILAPTEHVFEYRSGRLIEGTLDSVGNFTPKLGSKITDFGEYKYSPSAPRIYNLPGHFVVKKPKKVGA
jgi:hypothetical protein